MNDIVKKETDLVMEQIRPLVEQIVQRSDTSVYAFVSVNGKPCVVSFKRQTK